MRTVDPALVAAQVALAAVFIAAGVGKLFDLAGSRRALAGFGVPEGLASIGGTVLPLIELATAVALLLRPSAQWGGVAALALMLAFIGGISNAMARGQTPDCNCFGALHSAKAGWNALGRNAALAILAAFVAVRGPGPSITGWLADRSAAELVAIGTGIATLALVAVSLRTWWQNRRLSRQLAAAREALAAVPPGLPVGAMAPEFAVPDVDGGTLTLTSLRSRGLPVALVFSRPGCGPSENLLPDLVSWKETLAHRLTIGLVGQGDVARYEAKGGQPLVEALERDPEFARAVEDLFGVFAAYRLNATPSAVILTPEGTIASATVHGRPAIEALLRLNLARATMQPTPIGVGGPAA